MDSQELLLTAGRTAVIYVFLLVVVRLLGKRTVGNFSAFDLIVALILGEVTDEAIFGDVPMAQGLLAIVVIALLHFANSVLSCRSEAFDKLTAGAPSVLVRNGKVMRKALALERINEQELNSMLRLKEIEDVDEVKEARLEPSGQVSVIKVDAAKELQKGDLKRGALKGS